MKRCVRLLLATLLIVPTALADWVPMAGPEGANIIAFGTHNSYLFAGTAGAGIMRSSDNGHTWAPANNGFGTFAATDFLSQGGVVYAAAVGVYRSTDNGGTWTAGTGLSGGVSVSSLATDGTRLYAAMPSTGSTPLGVFRSTDGGATWTGSNTGIPANSGVSELCYSGGKLFAGIQGSTLDIYQSTDNGVTWTTTGPGGSGQYIEDMVAAPGAVLAGTSGAGILRSTNNGTSWVAANTGLPPSSNVFAMYLDGTTVYACVSVYGGQALLYRSTDNGASWSAAGLTAPQVSTITAMTKSGSFLLTGSVDQGMHRSPDNGASWARANTGVVNSRVNSVVTLAGAVFAGTALDGVFRTTNNGTSWSRLTNGLPGIVKTGALVTRGSTVILIGSVRDSVYAWRSTNLGDSWTRGALVPGFAYPSHRGAVVSGSSLIMVRGTQEVVRSTDDGASWTNGTGIGTGTSLATVGVHAGAAYAGGSTMYKSTNDGVSWAASGTGIPTFPNLIAIASTGTGVFTGGAYAAAVYRSTNSGANWAAAAPVPGAAPSDLHAVGSALFAGVNNNGVFISTNNGGSWTTIRTGLPTTGIVYHLLTNDATQLYCATDTRGVWRRPLSEVTAVRELSEQIPVHTALDQNYPNPFNPSTVIRFSVQRAEPVRLAVYDLLGREVAVLVDGTLAAGSYETTLDASGLSSGVYLYRLTASGNSLTRRMVLAR